LALRDSDFRPPPVESVPVFPVVERDGMLVVELPD